LIVDSSDLPQRLFLQSMLARDKYGATGEGITIAVIGTGFHAKMLELESIVEPIKIGHKKHEMIVLNPEDDSEDTHDDVNAAVIHTVAPNAKLMNIRVASNERGSTESRVAKAIDLVVRHKKKYGTPNILNISMGVKRTSHLSPFFVCDGACQLCEATNTAMRAGLLCVVSAGNHGGTPIRGPITCPGASREAVTVGAVTTEPITTGVDRGKHRVIVSQYSSWGPVQASWNKPNIVAPGTLPVRSRFTFPFPGYVPEVRLTSTHSGTSFSTAFVSGAAALVMQKTNDMDLVKNSMYLGAEDLGSSELAEGNGMLNIFEAVKFAERRRQHFE